MAERIPIPWNRRINSFRGTPMALTVWLMAILIASVLWVRRAERFELVGLAQALEYPISTETTGTLASVWVELYETVEQGQLLVRMDESALLARLETAKAELERSRSDLHASAANLSYTGASVSEDLRRFQIDEQQLRLDMLEIRVRLDNDRVEKDRLELEHGRLEQLVAAGIGASADLEDLELRLRQVSGRLAKTRELYKQTEQASKLATHRLRSFESRFGDSVSSDPQDALAVALRVQDLRIREIEVARAALTLRAPVSGQVSRIHARPGQSVLPGEPILAVTESYASEFVAYLPPEASGSVERDQIVLAASASSPKRVVETYVLRVGPAIEELPRQAWANPTVPEYGRPFILAAAPSLGLIPGETVHVSLSSRRREPPAAASPGPVDGLAPAAKTPTTGG